MASSSKISLNEAIAAMESAYARLAATVEIAAHNKAQSASAREAEQNEATRSWENHCAELEASLAQSASENKFLREDNMRLSNQLQQLQLNYLELQETAGHVASRIDHTVRQLDLILEH